MNKKFTETEAKFYIADLDALALRLEALGAKLTMPRVHEYNLRFDTPAEDIRRDGCVLRLRRDSEARLTFKGVSSARDGVLSREEIEFTVGDFNAAQRFLEALGYRTVAVYEKYRRVYTLDQFDFMLDELPYGNFLEIEGADAEGIRDAAKRIGLSWAAVVDMGYLGIFRRLCAGADLDETNLTFDALGKQVWSLDELAIIAADTL